MAKFFIATCLLLTLFLTKTFADVSSLQDNTQEHLDPLKDQEQDLSANTQDKRTICGALNKCSGGNTGGQVRHVFVRSGLKHQLVGYANIIRPVGLRPVAIGGYRYPKPKIHFRLKAPSSLRPVFGGWTPVLSGSKTVHEVKTPGHLDVVHNSPVPHVDHVQTTPVHVDHVHQNVAGPVHLDHVHVQPNHVHLQPIQPVHVHPLAVQGAHVDEVHEVSVQHGNHIDSFSHLDHVHHTAVPAAQTVVPVAPQPTIVRPFVPSPVLFEVTRPNLGVLPLGARFPSPVLREVPHVHFRPAAVPVAPVAVHPLPEPVPHHHFHAAPVPHHHHHPVQGIIQTHVGLPHIAPQPGVSVEYHGTRNFVPVHGSGAILHQSPVNAVQPFPPSIFGLPTAHTHQQLPFEHAQHGFVTQQRLPHDHPAHEFVSQQQLPHDHPARGFVSQQQLPHDHQAQGFISQQLPHEHQVQFSTEQQLPGHFSPQFLQNQVQTTYPYQDIPQGQLPLEGEQQQFDEFHQSNQDSFSGNSVNVQDFNQNNVIQPGHTDLQIPYHLPQHPGWDEASGYPQQQQSGLQEESRGFSDQVFRPSHQLEAPYKK